MSNIRAWSGRRKWGRAMGVVCLAVVVVVGGWVLIRFRNEAYRQLTVERYLQTSIRMADTLSKENDRTYLTPADVEATVRRTWRHTFGADAVADNWGRPVTIAVTISGDTMDVVYASAGGDGVQATGDDVVQLWRFDLGQELVHVTGYSSGQPVWAWYEY